MSRKYKRLIMICVGIILILFSIMLILSKSTFFKPSTELTQTEAEQFIGHNLPKNAKEIFLKQDVGLDRAVFVRFTSSPQDAELFLKEIGISSPLTNRYGKLVSQTVNPVDWWNPTSHEDIVGAQNMIDNMKYETAIYKISDSEWVLYLVVF